MAEAAVGFAAGAVSTLTDFAVEVFWTEAGAEFMGWFVSSVARWFEQPATVRSLMTTAASQSCRRFSELNISRTSHGYPNEWCEPRVAISLKSAWTLTPKDSCRGNQWAMERTWCAMEFRPVQAPLTQFNRLLQRAANAAGPRKTAWLSGPRLVSVSIITRENGARGGVVRPRPLQGIAGAF